MTIDQIIEMQKNFDKQHKGNFNWDQKITDKNIEILEYLLLCMIGEFGETSNIIKKVLRGDFILDEVRDKLSEEVVDIFIYTLKLAYQLDIDIEKSYLKKMDINKMRFKNFETKKEDNNIE